MSRGYRSPIKSTELQIYEELWSQAVLALTQGAPQIDATLRDRAQDARRGVTLILRPSAIVRARVKCFLDRLKTEFPEQYFYLPEELHVTVLSIISGSVHWRKEIRQLASFRAVIREVLSRQRSFKIQFQGVTASPGAVLIQGFSENEGLSMIRNDLRQAFANAGFSNQLDRRYKISTAHLTAMRFSQPHADWKLLLAMLEEARQMDFGQMEVDRLQLVWGDWYASAQRVRVLKEYSL